MSSSPPPESGLEEEAGASPGSGHGNAAEEAILKPVKPEAGAEDGVHIHIKVTSQTAPEVFFRAKRDMKMQRIIDMYCGKYSLLPKTVVFMNEEKYIRADQTVEEAGLEDGSTIDVHMAQLGGSGRASV
jgi:small ubiquitin-related modifier